MNIINFRNYNQNLREKILIIETKNIRNIAKYLISNFDKKNIKLNFINK